MSTQNIEPAIAAAAFATEKRILEEYSRGDQFCLQRMMTRRELGEPIEYVVGEVVRGGLPFFVDRRCYIPDINSLLLVDEFVRDIRVTQGPLLELGTGCGWMAILLATKLPSAEVIATDIDPSALELARLNAKRHSAGVAFFEAAYVDGLPISGPDFVIADLPYGGDGTYSRERQLVRASMPPVSVCPREGPMHCYAEAIRSIRRKGWQPAFYMETGYLSPSRIRDAIGQSGVDVRQIKDNFSVTVIDLSRCNFE